MEVIHSIRGRMRVRLPHIRADALQARQIEQMLGSFPAVRQVQANPLTATVLIHYDPEQLQELLENTSDEQLRPALERVGMDMAALRRLLHENGHSDEDADGHLDLEATIRSAADKLDKRFHQATGGLSLRLLVPIALVALGLRSLLMKEKLMAPSWYEYLWFGLATFYLLNSGESPGRALKEAVEVAEAAEAGAAGD